MTKQIIINSGIREKRAAILEDNLLEDIFFERDSYDQIAGNIYRGRVMDVLPGMQAAFVDIGIDKNAFLHISDLYPLLNEKQIKLWNDNKLGIQNVLQPGQEIMVQITKESIGEKGAKLSCKISLAGRYFVLLPLDQRINISRKISYNNERKRLKKIANDLIKHDLGVIIRTNAQNREEEDLIFDYDYLYHLWQDIKNKYEQNKAPCLLYHNVGLIQQIVRDYLSYDIDKLVIDAKEDFEAIKRLVAKIAPHLKNKVHFYDKKTPIFINYGIEKELLKALKHKVWLDSGGYIIFDNTEALVSIDVNTGKYTGKNNLQETVFKTNLEAAKEIARQLRIRDIGGIIIIDFIDMTIKVHQQEVLKTLGDELLKDRTKTALLGLTKLGLVEMTRKKVREGLGELVQKPCPYCSGTGMVMSENTMALNIIREINNLKLNMDFSAILIETHPRVAAVLIGTGGEKLAQLENSLDLDIYLSGNNKLHIEEYNILNKGSKEEMKKLALPVKIGEKYTLLVEERHINKPEDGIARIKGYIIIIKEAGHLLESKVEVEIVETGKTFAWAVQLTV